MSRRNISGGEVLGSQRLADGATAYQLRPKSADGGQADAMSFDVPLRYKTRGGPSDSGLKVSLKRAGTDWYAGVVGSRL